MTEDVAQWVRKLDVWWAASRAAYRCVDAVPNRGVRIALNRLAKRIGLTRVRMISVDFVLIGQPEPELEPFL